MSRDQTPTAAVRTPGCPGEAPAVLVQPPVLDPYAPLLGVPALSAALKRAGIPAVPVDLNLELHEAVATAAGLAMLRSDRRAELARLGELAAANELRPELVRAAMGRSVLEQPDLAAEIRAAQEALRDPRLYHFGADGSLKLTARLGAHHAVPGLLAIPPAPFSSERALRLLRGEEPLPFRTWLDEAAVPRIDALHPAWVGLSVTFEQQLMPALILAGLLRRRGIRVFAGGFHLSTVGGAGLVADPGLFDLVDGVVVGEGEIAVVALDRALRAGGSLHDVPGLVHRDDTGAVHARGPAPPPDMAELATPDLVSMPLGRYLSPVVILPYQASRGCYFGKCTFCNFTAVSPGYRRRPLPQVMDDLGALAELGRCINFTMEAELPKVCGELSDAIVGAGLDLIWEVMCRLDRGMSRDILERMARAGCTTIFFGLESASARLNALMYKSVSGSVARRIIEDCADVGINLVLSGIKDFPGETPLEQAQTAGFYGWVQERVGDRILVSGGLHTFRLTRSSPIWQDPGAFGIEPMDLAEVGPLAVSAPFRVARGQRSDGPGGPQAPALERDRGRRAERDAAAAPPGRTTTGPGGPRRDALLSPEELRALQECRPLGARRRGPRRDPRPFNHDLLRLALEGCNPGGFRRLAIANRAQAPPPPPEERPERFRVDPRARLETLDWDPGTGAPAALLHCVHPAFSVEGVVVPAWFGAVLGACRSEPGLDLARLTELVDERRPQSSQPAAAWLGRYLPALWSAGVLAAAAP